MPENLDDRILQFHGKENTSNQQKLHILRRATMHPDTKKPFSRKDSDEIMQAIIMYEHLARHGRDELHLMDKLDENRHRMDNSGYG
ncbi:hypothetical protein SI65_04664 [Aspergillus cristatus]|uniref:Uncharacterized protein n=1 Tax=Aspergillus cristatus TaxID=573508 RepID=A0A1E3BFH1_ASPCR|nr:hypothetical protein SI65_04664 [Aspergillus cristatus]